MAPPLKPQPPVRQPPAATRHAIRRGAAASPPTERVLDVLELLARDADRDLTLTDVVRELGITYATAHAILATLGARGWVRRDATAKSYTLGPALGIVAQQAEHTDSLERRARATAAGLVPEFGFSMSVTQIIAGAVVITAFFAPAGSDARAHPGDRVPLAAPFGVGFMAWEPAAVRRAWVERAGIANASLRERLEATLAAIRERGFAVERMTESARPVLELAKNLPTDVVSDDMREIINRLVVEITSPRHLPDDLRAAPKAHVSTIAAPVFDRTRRVQINLCVHPFQALPGRRIEQLGRALRQAAGRIGDVPGTSGAHAVTSAE